MMLVDDAAMRLIEPLAQMDLPKLYDTQLMLGGGHTAALRSRANRLRGRRS